MTPRPAQLTTKTKRNRTKNAQPLPPSPRPRPARGGPPARRRSCRSCRGEGLRRAPRRDRNDARQDRRAPRPGPRPDHREELPALRGRRPLRRHDLPPRHPGLHDPGRRIRREPAREAHARADSARGAGRPAQRPLHDRDGPHVLPALGDLAVLHQRRRQRLPQRRPRPGRQRLLRLRLGDLGLGRRRRDRRRPDPPSRPRAAARETMPHLPSEERLFGRSPIHSHTFQRRQ